MESGCHCWKVGIYTKNRREIFNGWTNLIHLEPEHMVFRNPKLERSMKEIRSESILTPFNENMASRLKARKLSLDTLSIFFMKESKLDLKVMVIGERFFEFFFSKMGEWSFYTKKRPFCRINLHFFSCTSRAYGAYSAVKLIFGQFHCSAVQHCDLKLKRLPALRPDITVPAGIVSFSYSAGRHCNSDRSAVWH